METLSIRPDWIYDVNVLGQHLVFECADADRAGVERALRAFSQRFPAARTFAEREWLRERCRVWAGKLDQHLALLEKGEAMQARAAADATIEQLIAALEKKAKT